MRRELTPEQGLKNHTGNKHYPRIAASVHWLQFLRVRLPVVLFSVEVSQGALRCILQLQYRDWGSMDLLCVAHVECFKIRLVVFM